MQTKIKGHRGQRGVKPSRLILSKRTNSFPEKKPLYIYRYMYVCMYLHLNMKYMRFLFLRRIFSPTLFKMNIDKRLVRKRESTVMYVASDCQC